MRLWFGLIVLREFALASLLLPRMDGPRSEAHQFWKRAVAAAHQTGLLASPWCRNLPAIVAAREYIYWQRRLHPEGRPHVARPALDRQARKLIAEQGPRFTSWKLLYEEYRGEPGIPASRSAFLALLDRIDIKDRARPPEEYFA
jgi:hypothetical protein